MNRTAQVTAELLRAFLDQDPDNIQRLIGAGIKPALIDQTLNGSIELKNLYIIAQRLVDVAKIDIREIFFASAYEEVAGPEPRPPSLADITSFSELAAVFGGLLAPITQKQASAYFGIGEKVVARKWLTGWPNAQRIEQMLRFVRESREKTIVFPPVAEETKPAIPPATKAARPVDWRARFRELGKKHQARYSRDAVAAKLGIKPTVIKHWLTPSELVEPKPEHMKALRRDFPEFFGEDAPKPDAAPIPAPVVNQQKALSSLISMMFSGINVITQVVDPKQIVDGEKARVIEVVSKLFVATGIDRKTFARLSRVDLLDPNDPAMSLLFGKPKH